MAKRGRKPVSDYKKIGTRVAGELAEKRKAFVKAEKALARAQAAHQELLSEVARLDMLDRCLKAVTEKTAPPQNIKYVYTYPQWVWNPNSGTGWWYNGNGQITLGSQTITGNLQGGSQLYTNCQNSNYTVNNGGPHVTLTGFNSSGSIQSSAPSSLAVNNTGVNLCTTNTGMADFQGTILTSAPGLPKFTSVDGTIKLTNPEYGADGSITVDLTTHAPSEEQEEALKASTKAQKADAEADLVSA